MKLTSSECILLRRSLASLMTSSISTWFEDRRFFAELQDCRIDFQFIIEHCTNGCRKLGSGVLDFEISHFSIIIFSRKTFSQFRVGKIKFHHLPSPRFLKFANGSPFGKYTSDANDCTVICINICSDMSLISTFLMNSLFLLKELLPYLGSAQVSIDYSDCLTLQYETRVRSTLLIKILFFQYLYALIAYETNEVFTCS